MKRRSVKKLLAENESIQEAIKKSVPLRDAIRIYENANNKVENGEWIELHKEKPDYSTSKLEPNLDSVSVIRYWGPKEYLDENDSISSSKAKSLFERGLIGKTHELLRGSDLYGVKYVKSRGKYSKQFELGKHPSHPPIGSRVLHRHWEISQMYRKRKRGLEGKLIALLVVIVSSSFIAFSQIDLVGYASKIQPNPGLLPLLVIIIIAMIIFIIKGHSTN
ncbi:hypothetical protein HYT58_03155 [Candidatus Woesearchaeota archaeon]|nr:hypothetical protein [Candidatus Woesearchaeota archaeon]